MTDLPAAAVVIIESAREFNTPASHQIADDVERGHQRLQQSLDTPAGKEQLNLLVETKSAGLRAEMLGE